jgi:hypothetical protein
MPTTPPRNPATQTCYLLCTLCTISHPPDFLSFHRLSFPLRQFSLWILRKIITSGRWGEEPADACAAALSRRGAGRLESALESAGVRAAPRRPTGIGTGIRGRARGAAPADWNRHWNPRACARGPRRARGAPRRSTGIRTGIRGRARGVRAGRLESALESASVRAWRSRAARAGRLESALESATAPDSSARTLLRPTEAVAGYGQPPLGQPTSRPCEGLVPGEHVARHDAPALGSTLRYVAETRHRLGRLT